MKKGIYYQLKQLEGEYFTNTLSNAGKWLNYKLVSIEEGKVEVSILVREDMANPNNMLHGGMIGMISDEICGLALYSIGQANFYTTVNLSIDYLFSAAVGSVVTAKASVLRHGKKIANVECYIYDEMGNVISHAKSNLVNTGKEVFDLITSKN